MKNKRQRLLISVCAPTVAALALGCGTAGLIVGLKKHSTDDRHFKDAKVITFDPGIGSFANNNHVVEKVECGTTLERVAQPEVILPKGRYFAGWKTPAGALCNGQEVIKNDMKLVASNAELTSDYALVKFQAPETPSGVILQGNVTCAIKKGYQFYMVNRPQASYTDPEGKEWYFKNWVYANSPTGHYKGEDVRESDEISENTVLEPKFTRAVTVQWHAGHVQAASGHEVTAEITRGSEITTLESGSEFGQFNQPELQCIDPNPGTGDPAEYYFAGWYKTDPYSGEAEAWDETTPVYAEDEADTVHAWAKWAPRPAPTERYSSVGFYLPEGFTEDDFRIAPNDIVLVEKGTNWGNTNKPNFIALTDHANNYKVTSWQYTTDLDESTHKPIAEAVWYDLSDSYVFSDNYGAVRPVMIEAVDSVTATVSTTTPLPEETVQCTAIVKGGAKSQEVTWALYSDADCLTKLDTAIASVNDDGEIEVKSIDYSTSFYVQATAKLTESWETPVKSTPIKLTVKLPYEDSADIWFHQQIDDENWRWFKLSIDDICDESVTTMVAEGITGNTYSIDKTDTSNMFTLPLYFGDQIISIKSNFGRNWKSLNSYLRLADSNVQYIASGFLSGCTNFNNGSTKKESKTLDLSRLATIGDDFMTDCTSFNQPITFVPSDGVSVSPLKNIGQNFLDSCTSFDSPLTLPNEDGQSVDIEQGFLIHCRAFNQNITFPYSVKYIGNFCMNGCNFFTSTITVDCPTSAFTGTTGDFVGNASNTPIASQGFTVAGTNALFFADRYPTQSMETGYRTIAGTATMDEATWVKIIDTFAYANSVTLEKVKSDGSHVDWYKGENLQSESPLTVTRQGTSVLYDISRVEQYTTGDKEAGTLTTHSAYVKYLHHPLETPKVATIQGVYSGINSIPFYSVYNMLNNWTHTSKWDGWKYDTENDRFLSSNGKDTYYIKLDEDWTKILELGRVGDTYHYLVSDINSTDLSEFHDNEITYGTFKGVLNGATTWAGTAPTFTLTEGETLPTAKSGIWHRLALHQASMSGEYPYDTLKISMNDGAATPVNYDLNTSKITIYFVSNDGSNVITASVNKYWTYDTDTKEIVLDLLAGPADLRSYEIVFHMAVGADVTTGDTFIAKAAFSKKS